MKCCFAYCVYSKNNACLLEKTEINPYGMCEECLLVSLPDADLRTMKERQLEAMEERRKSLYGGT
mgnify:FL=1|jgi:hypothetical protein